ncbi:MAG: hypothetical protein QOF33_4918 [Thermomicrobiales bacterium]|nr:hypothetical protein [Thermomicrobiales bacterium]
MRTVVTTTAENPPRRPSKLLGTDAWIALGAIAVCLALVLGVRLVARDAPSSGRSVVVGIPTPVVSTAAGCDNFARFWMDESGVDASAATIEAISNCRRSADGAWFVPSGVDDPRLPRAPVLTQDQKTATADLRTELLSQIEDLEATFPSTLRAWLNQLYDPFARSVVGHLREGPSIRTARNRYTRLTQAYLMAPDRQEFADYVGWAMARRIRAYDDLKTTCLSDPDLEYLRTACLGLEDNLSIRNPPFIWDLKDPLLLDTYLVSTLSATTDATPTAGT